jgi:hypothetical protein
MKKARAERRKTPRSKDLPVRAGRAIKGGTGRRGEVVTNNLGPTNVQK